MKIQEYEIMNEMMKHTYINQRELAEITGYSVGKVNQAIKTLLKERYLKNTKGGLTYVNIVRTDRICSGDRLDDRADLQVQSQRRHGNPSVGIYSGHCPGDTLAGHRGDHQQRFLQYH